MGLMDDRDAPNKTRRVIPNKDIQHDKIVIEIEKKCVIGSICVLVILYIIFIIILLIILYVR